MPLIQSSVETFNHETRNTASAITRCVIEKKISTANIKFMEIEAVCQPYMNLSLKYKEIEYILCCLNLISHHDNCSMCLRNIHILR